eukprot:PITA_04103
MTGNREYFSELDEKDMQVNIELGDNGNYDTKGVGSFNFERESSNTLHLRDVVYVPWLKKNFVSAVNLEDKGYDVTFSRGKSYLQHFASGRKMQIGVRVKNIYKLDVETDVALSPKERCADAGELWHRCMGHLHHGALKILQQITTGLPIGGLDKGQVCKGCTLGKYDKSSSMVRIAKPKIYFMKKKYEVLDKFMEFKALVEKRTRKKIKAVRSDNGGEYISNAFKDFCAKESIRRELISPHNPQQHEVAERKNMRIVGATIAMLHDQDLPRFLWA